MATLSKPLVAAAIAIAWSAGAQAATFKTLADIHGTADGQMPYAAPLKLGGALYGTTISGGKFFDGAVYRQNPATGRTTTIYSFTGGADGGFPNALLAVDGMLYGTTSGGAKGGNGALFKIDPATGQETTLYDFAGGNDGSAPYCGLIYVGGVLFGTTQVGGAGNAGIVFGFNLATGAETVVHTFGVDANDGAYPYAGLTKSGKLLYGTTYYGGSLGWGTVYAIDPQTGAEKILHAFVRSDGYYPFAGLVANGHTLYGTTLFYGADLPGEVFAVDRDSGAETTLYQFTGASDGGSPYAAPTLRDGTLYGTSSHGSGTAPNGTIYEVDLATGAERTLLRFDSALGTPLLAGLLDVDGTLYGATYNGGVTGGGALYSFDTDTRRLTLAHSFTGVGPGGYPAPALTAAGAGLYVVTPQGGAGNFGAVLRLDAATGAVRTLASFAGGPQGFAPAAPLLNLQGSLYGTTYGGDPAHGITGTVFKLARAGGAITTLHRFKGGNDGANPDGALVDVNGTLWGTTLNQAGTVFKIDPATGKTTTVHDFGGSGDGWSPQGPLVAAGGLLYGTTLFDCCGDGPGTIFQIDPKTGQETVAYDFDYGDPIGLYPSGGLVRVGKKLYAALIDSADGGPGVIASFDPAKDTAKALYDFTGGSDGAAPYAPPIEMNGLLYGTTSGGAAGYGTVYALNPKNRRRDDSLHFHRRGRRRRPPGTAAQGRRHALRHHEPRRRRQPRHGVQPDPVTDRAAAEGRKKAVLFCKKEPKNF